MSITNALNRFLGQPESYEKKSKYVFGKRLGEGTYGKVVEARGPTGLVACKIIQKGSLHGNEKMVYDELEMLQRLNHPRIVKFVDWFESKLKFYILTELATGGELFDRIVERGKFTEKDASVTIKQILMAVDYLHKNGVVHRDLKPENLLYLTREPDSDLVLADFGIAKSLDNDTEKLRTMAGSFGYAAPEVMDNEGHGKPVDMWSMGVITYTLLCGYSPFRAQSIEELKRECKNDTVVFHQQYWKDVSQDAKDFIQSLIVTDPDNRMTAEQALKHIWLSGQNASDVDLYDNLKTQRRFQKAIIRLKLRKNLLLANESIRKVELGEGEKTDGDNLRTKDDEFRSDESDDDLKSDGLQDDANPDKTKGGSKAKGERFFSVVHAMMQENKNESQEEAAKGQQ